MNKRILMLLTAVISMNAAAFADSGDDIISIPENSLATANTPDDTTEAPA